VLVREMSPMNGIHAPTRALKSPLSCCFGFPLVRMGGAMVGFPHCSLLSSPFTSVGVEGFRIEDPGLAVEVLEFRASVLGLRFIMSLP